MHPVDEIFAAFDNSPTKLGRAVGLKTQTVWDWRGKGPPNIPDWRRPAVLAALKAANIKLSAETMAYLASAERAAA